MHLLTALLFALSTLIALAGDLLPLKTVPNVNLSRYLGKWYEIARFPNSFQKDCDQAVAEYSLLEDEKIQVTNTCKGIKDGRVSSVTGIARVKDPATYAKLKVNFVPSWLRWTGLGNGDYWIIDLDEGYTYAVISEPSRKYLWILCRTPTMPQTTYRDILKRLRDQNFEVSKLIPSR